MITDWIAQAGLFFIAVVVLFGPGLAVGAAVRLRGLLLIAAAPAVSVGLLAALAIFFPLIGIRWGRLPVALTVVSVALLLYGITRVIQRGRRRSPQRMHIRTFTPLIAMGLVVGGVLNAARLMTVVGVPGAVSQTNDAVFHLNALRWIAESGSASSFDVSGLIGGTTFYPSAWHAVASLVASDFGEIPPATNMLSLALVALVWPMAITALTWVVSGGRSVVAALAGALSAGLLAFPQLMFEWGVLYPYALSLAVLPAVVAVTIATLRIWTATRGAGRWSRSAGHLLVVVIGVVGIGLAQPSSLLFFGLLVLLYTTLHVLRRAPRWSVRAKLGAVGALTAAWGALSMIWLLLAYLAGPVLWRSYRSPVGALVDVVINSHAQLPAAWAVSVLLVIGLIQAVLRPQWRWYVFSWAAVSFLYVVSVATDLPIIKRALTGPWYGDSFRLAALVPIVVVPLAALGLEWVVRYASRASAFAAPMWRLGLPAAAMSIVLTGGAISVALSPVVLLRVADETDAYSRYALTEDSYLSIDELALMRRLPDLVPEDALLIANPSTGAAFTYLLGERDIVPRTWAPPGSQAWETLSTRLRDAGTDPAVCEALAAYGSPDYVLDFGPGDDGPGLYVMRGMTAFAGQVGFEEIASQGDASLWRITACVG